MFMKAKIKRIPYGKQWIGKEEIRAVTRVLRSDFLTQGPLVSKFEDMLAKKVGAKYAVAVANGTAALHLAASVIGLKPRDEVITTPISFLATSNAVLYMGAKPVFADIDIDTQCIDPAEIENVITSRTKAIFFTDFAGHPAELRKIHAIAKKYRLAVIEDAAHALGSTYCGSKIGSCRYSDMTIFSFHPVKHITTGEGGAITTNDRQLYARLCELRTHGVTRDPSKLFSKNVGPWYYEMQALGFNYRLTDIQAALGIEQLKKLDRFVARRRVIADKYHKAFAGLEGVLTPVERSKNRHVYHLFVIRFHGQLAKKRKAIFEELQKHGVGVQVHYIPIPAQPYYRNLGYRADTCPKAQDYYEAAISLPMFPKMTNEKVDIVIKAVNDVVRLHS
jgi:UDP-4-amino-4,6-dideoxy-N-acetyl-beta-L-altrosamine transaminase